MERYHVLSDEMNEKVTKEMMEAMGKYKEQIKSYLDNQQPMCFSVGCACKEVEAGEDFKAGDIGKLVTIKDNKAYLLKDKTGDVVMPERDNVLKDIWEDTINKAIDERIIRLYADWQHGLVICLNEMEKHMIHTKYLQDTKGKEYSKGYNDALQFFKGIVKSLED